MESVRKVVLSPDQAMLLYGELATTTDSNRRERRELEALDKELGEIVEAKAKGLEARVEYRPPKESAEKSFSFKAIRGAKLVLVQAIAGMGQLKKPASYGRRKHGFMPIAEAFGKKMVEIILKETDLEAGGDEEVDWNEDPKPTDGSNENVDLGEAPKS